MTAVSVPGAMPYTTIGFAYHPGPAESHAAFPGERRTACGLVELAQPAGRPVWGSGGRFTCGSCARVLRAREARATR